MKNLTYSLCCVLLSALFLTSCAKDSLDEQMDTAKLRTDAYPVSYSDIEIEVLDLINQYRVEQGLRELEILDDNSRQAELHNQHMIAEGKVCHDGFPARYSALVDKTDAKAVSENVAYGYRSAEAVVAGWIKSEDHKKNMVGNHTHFGIAINSDENGKFYFTNIFVRK